jgi:hypothetical protein
MEDHVTGWLAICWTSLALAPMKRWIIVSPLSRKKLALRGAKALRAGYSCRASENRPSPRVAVEERRHCLLQLGRAAMEAPSG